MDGNLQVAAATVALYTAGIIAFGIWQARKAQDSAEDYYLASRSLSGWLAGFSGAASSESGWVLLGLVGTAYAGGISALWLIPGCLAGYLFNWFVLGPRLRRAAKASGAVTVPEVLASLSNGHGRTVQLLAGWIVLALMTAYVAAQLNAVGKALDAVFDLPYGWGVVVGVAIVFAYLPRFGFRSSTWTDLVQGTLMIVTVVVLPLAGVLLFDGSIAAALADDPALSAWTGGTSGFAGLGFVIGWLGIGLGYPGLPHVQARVMGAAGDRELRLAGTVAAVWSTCVFTGAIMSGLVIRAWLPGIQDPEQALPIFALTLLPAAATGLILAAVLAAICSTADSQLLVAASAVGRDILRVQDRLREPQEASLASRATRLLAGTSAGTALDSIADESAAVATGASLEKNLNVAEARANRVILVLLGVAGAVLAATENRVIFDFVLYAWAVLGATLGPALIAVLFWHGITGRGIVAGMLAGGLTAVIWQSTPALADAVYVLVPAFLIGLLVVWGWPRQVPSYTPARHTMKLEN